MAVGEKLGRYEIVRHLASGGMADVLLARTTGIGGFERHVLVKRIHTENAKDERFRKMFLDEARLAAMLHHGNIVQVHEVGDEAGTIYFAMEYVHGEDLRRVLGDLSKKREKPPFEHIIAIISAAADALHHAHEQHGSDGKPLGLVHRDVTPANILIGYDGIVKVCDFGIAKAAIRSSETQAGTMKGKVAYMSPEGCTGKPVDRRSDVFSLGIVLFELVCVRRLFKGENDFLTMSAIVEGKVKSPRELRPDLPRVLEDIIMKALAPRPEDRFQTAAEMSAALDALPHCSPKSLAAYMKQRFGSRPEPWLVESDEPEISIGADFDGSASGVVDPPQRALDDLAIPQEIEATGSAPIRRAHRSAMSTRPPLPSPFTKRKPSELYALPQKRISEPIATVQVAPELAAMTETVDDGWGASDKEVTPSIVPALAEGTAAVSEEVAPSEIVPVPPGAGKLPWWQRKRARIAGAGGAGALLVIVLIAKCSGGSAKATATAAETGSAAAVAKSTDTAAATAPAPATATAPAASAGSAAATGSAAVADTTPVPATAAAKHPAKPPPAKTAPTKKTGKRPHPKMLFD
jgi:serine/threonine-protein kinase